MVAEDGGDERGEADEAHVPEDEQADPVSVPLTDEVIVIGGAMRTGLPPASWT